MDLSVISMELRALCRLIASKPDSIMLDELHEALSSHADTSASGLQLIADYLALRAFAPDVQKLDQSLAVEWTRLCRGVPAASGLRVDLPCEGLWTAGLQEAGLPQLFIELKTTYQNAGVCLSAASARPDELWVQLDFLALLLERSDAASAENFLENHVLMWVPRFAKKAGERATSTFYQGVFEYLGWVLEITRKEVSHDR